MFDEKESKRNTIKVATDDVDEGVWWHIASPLVDNKYSQTGVWLASCITLTPIPYCRLCKVMFEKQPTSMLIIISEIKAANHLILSHQTCVWVVDDC